jgi:hypothetical protein
MMRNINFKHVFFVFLLASGSANSGIDSYYERWRDAIERNEGLRKSVMQKLNADNSAQCAAYIEPGIGVEKFGGKLSDTVSANLGFLRAATEFYRRQMLKSGVPERTIDKVWKFYDNELMQYGPERYSQKYGVMCIDLVGDILINTKK